MGRQWLDPGRRATFLVLLGACLVSVALTVGVLARAPAPAPVSAPEPVTPAGDTSAPASTAVSNPTSPAPEVTSPEPGSPPRSSPVPDPPATSRARKPTATGPATAFDAVAGPACPVDGTRGTRISNGWQVVPGGSWTGNGCGDRFLYTPPDEPNYLQWLFTFDAPGARTCRIEVFVPDSPLASATVWYGVGDRVDNADYRVGGFTLDQKANRGRWAMAATIPVGTNTLLVNVDGDAGMTGVAAGPLRASCAPYDP
jgi:hypothetical protein